MNSRIIYQTDAGGVAVIIPANCGLTIEEIAAKDVPAGKPFHIVDVSDIPSDRTFRGAWNLDLSIDMTKARNIHLAKLRELRKPKMEALDTAYMRADELGDTAEKARISVLKQALRDVTIYPPISAAKTAAELKAAIPSILV